MLQNEQQRNGVTWFDSERGFMQLLERIPLGAWVIVCIVVLIGILVWSGVEDQKYERDLLSRARTFADTIQVQQLMEQRRLRQTAAIGAGLIAGGAAARR